VQFTNEGKKKQGGKDWVAIAALVPGRTQIQRKNIWHGALHPSISRTATRTGIWREEEDIELKAAVHTHGDKDWVANAALVPSRTRIQCRNRLRDPSIDRVNRCMRKWKKDEYIKLNAAVHTHGGNNWVAIAALAQG
jgi:hypothetical protein